MIYSEELKISTEGEVQLIDLTQKVQQVVSRAGVQEGLACIFVPGSTGAITTTEFEPGLMKDIPDMLERIAPKEISYAHHETWHDWNGHSHVRASLIGPSLTVPVQGGKLYLGTWQQIVFVELDVRARERKILVQIVGE
jgi:secondary thiamine-phosphate synthase enzyme